jgi:glucuronoarabinoxylan endo-1,4-beta-xylanase
MKTNGNVVGGSLSTGSYGAFANYLESFVTYMANNGVSLYAISMQNEPDYVPNYEGCGWTGQQMDTWVANNSSVLTTRLMMPESASFNFSQSDPTLNDANAVGHVSIIAGHLYGATIQYYTNAENHGKDVWATEHYLTPSGSWPAIGDGIAAAQEFHNAMTVGSYNAYVWWWIAQDSGGGSGSSNINYGLVDNSGNPTYYGYALGQFSRFVRPGSVRVDASNAGSVLVSAYKNGTSGIIVAINPNGSASVTFNLQSLSASTVTPYVTSSQGGLMQQSAVGITNNSFNFTMPGQSIVTFVTAGSGGGSCSTAPGAPSGLTATAASSSSINLSWGAVTPPTNCSISSYTVYRSTTSGFTPSSSNQVGSASGTTFTDTGLTASTTYYYKVEAVDAAGSSAASAQASATTQSSGGGGGGGTLPTGTHKLVNSASGQCADDSGGSTSNGTKVQQYTCNSGNANQEWVITSVGNGYYSIATQNNTSAVWNVIGNGTSAGTGIQLYSYWSGGTNEQFKPIASGSGYELQDHNSGLCVADPNGSGSAGQQLEIEACNGASSVVWTVQ